MAIDFTPEFIQSFNDPAATKVLATVGAALADVKPAPLFGDHMVLQSGMSVPVWGAADPGEPVAVSFNGQRQSATADADGRWMVRLTGLQAGGPFEMTIAGKNIVTIKDILVGEVWLGSGQSNMAFTVSKQKARYAGLIDEEKEIAAANYPKLRMFTGKEKKSYDPQPVVDGEWQVCSPETVPGFSAVAYLFGRNLHKELNVPVGMVALAYGASTAEAWIPREALAADPLLGPMLDGFDAAVKFYRANPQAPGDQAPQPPQTINARPGVPPGQRTVPACGSPVGLFVVRVKVHGWNRRAVDDVGDRPDVAVPVHRGNPNAIGNSVLQPRDAVACRGGGDHSRTQIPGIEIGKCTAGAAGCGNGNFRILDEASESTETPSES